MLSVVVPVHNEAENIESLVREILAIADKVPLTEIIYVDDASTDGTLAELTRLKAAEPRLRVLKHSHRAGQSAGLWTAINAAKGTLIAPLDGDGQNDPANIIRLYETYQKGAANPRRMVAGQREKREDSALRRFSSRLANRVRSWALQDGVRDTGCALKLFRREDYLRLPYFNHMHRFLPAVMRMQGVEVDLVDVTHRPRLRGTSKYGVMNRVWVGIVDILGVLWLKARAYPVTLSVRED